MANGLCLCGLGLMGGAFYAVHPALCAGFVGVILTTLGVQLHRRGTGQKGQS